MGVGNPAAWADRFRSFDEWFLERVAAVWPRCLSVLPDRPDEDAITTNLVDLLQRDSGIRRRFHWIEFQYEPFGHTSEGTAYSKGRIDVAVILDQDRDRYLAYECKRLNDVREDGRRRSLAGEYVMEGLSRFVTERYSENLPVGCMLGYVLDGDVAYASARVRKKIVECRRKIALIGQPKDEAAVGAATRFSPVAGAPCAGRQDDEAAVGVATRFSSRHRRQGDGEIEVRHALLPVRPGGTAAGGAPGRGHDEGAGRDGASTASAAPADPRGGHGAPASLP